MTLRYFVNFFDFDYEKDEEGYHLIDLQGANLGDIESEVFETKEEVVGRFCDSIYEPDYITGHLEELQEEYDLEILPTSYEDEIRWCKENLNTPELEPYMECFVPILTVMIEPETVTESVRRTWKVYGAEGHRQRMSFYESDYHNFSDKGKTRKLWFDCSDKTGTNDYVRVTIERDSAEECERELEGQVTDGYFENVRTGKVEEILPDGTAVEVFLYPYQRKEPPKPSVAPPVSRGPRM